MPATTQLSPTDFTQKSELSISSRLGIGLRAPHIEELLARPTAISWVEVHNENWLTEDGPIAEQLQEIRANFDLSLHGVGLSLGSATPICAAHLRRIKALHDRCQPIFISEHICWSAIDGKHSNDLLPLPYNQESLDLLTARIDQVQQSLGRTLLIENISSYCQFQESTMPEWAFISELVERADCGLLLDFNNVYVNACNHDFEVHAYFSAIPWSKVQEVHLAGYELHGNILVDTHGREVQSGVWDLFQRYHSNLNADTKILIEWDNQLPTLDVLLGEAKKASNILNSHQIESREHAYTL